MTFWATNAITVWTATIDDAGQPSYSAPRTIYGTYKGTSKVVRDAGGDEFVPAQIFYLLEAVEKDDYIASGTFTGDPEKGTGLVKKIDVLPPQLGRSVTHYRVYTV